MSVRALIAIVATQLAALLLVGVYRYREGRRWLPRLVGGIALGTASAAILLYLAEPEAMRASVLALDGVLLLTAAFTWRSLVWLQRLTQYARALEAAPGAMIDRADEEQATVSAGLIGIFRHRELLRNLVLRDLKLKYRGSVFGFAWSLANPLTMIVVYWVAFTYILKVTVPGFVFLLLLGVLSWTFFANSASMSAGSIVGSGGLVKSVFFPRAVLPIATVLFNLAQYLLTILVFLPVMLILYRVPPALPMLLYPVFLMLQVLCITGFALALATATTFYRDVRHIVEIALGVLFWTTPIVYAFRQLPDALRVPILMSPMSSFVVAYQEILFYRQWPDLSVWIGAVVYGIGGFLVGAVLFATYEHGFAEQV
jgi:ABC-2 type transport system permease protein